MLNPLEAPLYQTYTKAVTPQAQAFLEKWKPKEEVKANTLF